MQSAASESAGGVEADEQNRKRAAPGEPQRQAMDGLGRPVTETKFFSRHVAGGHGENIVPNGIRGAASYGKTGPDPGKRPLDAGGNGPIAPAGQWEKQRFRNRRDSGPQRAGSEKSAGVYGPGRKKPEPAGKTE